MSIDNTTKAQRYVAEITVVIDAIGTTQTFYFATSGFATKPTDTPPNTHVSGRLKSAGSYRRELFSGARVTGAVRPSFGELVIYNTDGELDAWMGYGVSGGKVTVRLGDQDAAYPAGYTTVYIAYAQHLVADFDTLRVRLRDRLELLDQPMVKDSFKGTGGLEGTSELVSKLKQWVNQDPGFFPPILVDANKQLYFVQSTGTGGIGHTATLYEGGALIARGADYPDAATCLSTSPTAGQARFWLGVGGKGPVYFRLGSVPQFDLRIFMNGYHPTTGTQWTFSQVAELAGISGGTGTGLVGAQLVDDSRTYMQVLADASAAQFGYFGMTRLDAFVSGMFTVPGVPTATFTQHNARGWTRSPVQDMDAPVWSVTVNSGKTWPSNLVGSASTAMRDYLTRDPWWATFAAEDPAIKTANPGAVAEVLDVPVKFVSNTLDQSLFKAGYFARYGMRRDFYTFTTPLNPDNIALELHDTVQIKLPRFGLSSGKNMRIITQQIDCDSRSITYGVWG